MRISSTGSFSVYQDIALKRLQEGYQQLKIVARGRAVPLAEELQEVIKCKVTGYYFSVTYTKALNVRGKVVDELHVMISKEVLSEDEVRRDYADENETVSIPTKKFRKQMENYDDDYYEQEEEY